MAPQRRAADRALVVLLFEPLTAAGALPVPFLLAGDPGLSHGAVRDAQYAGGILDGVIVGKHGAMDVKSQCQDGDIHRGQPADVAGLPGGLLDLGD
ncbi:MAG: hypothetical protein PHF83_05210 [Candidatus Methanomethylophilus sp.]|nr:hypothetical protein [Methanomethylophilus sp.]